MSAAVTELALFAWHQNGEVIPGLPPPMACPFCGHTAEVTVDWHGVGFRAECYRCGAAGPFGATPIEAAKRWNARGRQL